ncbi:7635_t:CDS:2 [Rhizophagus irregularis]|nr:7635_t:CDS:2 [Rhizophagus irregularis]
MKIENLCSKITKEQMAQQDKELPLEEDEIGSQLKEVLEKAKVGFTFQQYMKLQEFRKDAMVNKPRENCNGDFFCRRVLFTLFHHAEPEFPKLKKIEAVIDLTERQLSIEEREVKLVRERIELMKLKKGT